MSHIIIRGRFGPLCEECVKIATRRIALKQSKSVAVFSRLNSTFPYNPTYIRSKAYKNDNLQQFTYGSGSQVSKTFLPQIRFVHNVIPRPLKTLNITGAPVIVLNHRQIGKLARVVGRVLKIRYFVLGTVAGGGVVLNQKYEEWKQYIPDIEWMKDYLPESETLDHVKNNVLRTLRSIHLPEKGWFTSHLPDLKGYKDLLSKSSLAVTNLDLRRSVPIIGFGRSSDDESAKKNPEKEKMEEIQEEMMNIQMRYQKEVERLEAENKDLRKQLLIKEEKTGKKVNWRKSLIDMYSDVLDELSGYDSTYNTQDYLPRVVVVGDQSSGKTSTLEMIAGARIFPRGSGEMMTRAPVKVTLSEGPYHVAKFKDSSKEFDLTDESELARLRSEVEMRMKKSVQEGQTVSKECISMTVKGPGIQRMVLVDLPGIISTETSVMAKDTREDIKDMVRTYMENPNAIILCIQDGSLDAERSNVTDIVRETDPHGKRTIFVLTKADMVENNLVKPERIKQILAGQLFPMNALAYFAVVTGKGNSNDSIQTIKEYEKQFFQKSKLFKDGVLKPSTTNTQNLSMSVSELFWKMVKETVEQQADAFKAQRFNLETEWKNTFPRLRELDRMELFEKAKGEILDEIINLSQVTAKEWEDAFSKKIWDKNASHIFESIYLPAAQAQNLGELNTNIDVKLAKWASGVLPKRCVEVGWDTLHDEFQRIVEEDKKGKDHDEIFDQLKLAVVATSKAKHHWESKAEDSLRVMQKNTLDDKTIPDKQHWDMAVKFMEETLREKLQQTENKLKEMTGPSTSEQWLSWQYKTEQHKQRDQAKAELDKILSREPSHKSVLAADELTTVKRNLHSQGVEVDQEFIKETWHHVYRQHFVKKSLSQAQECRKGFYYYKEGFSDSGLDCSDVVLFWRLHRMLQVTSNALRQQVVNNEARRLERIIKEVLEEYSENKNTLKTLLTGRRVTLAEELKTVRQIQDKLEEFIQALNKEK
ncbi:dynamin-like 120 kDa protein, mitochondrial isoform X2 [Mytilus californianus]|uniref:dynamin-like 120 kDa protein, mitochondrial isoform X2 n=1 Tax=Mytilus californianus TaxID=6549 RepID=UPI002245D5F4|nr:dynamin-like 120 kDa protein, mitochondrial isoform X2 [Mytilus californianus]